MNSNLSSMPPRSGKSWWTWVGLAGVVAVLCGIGVLVYRSLTVETVTIHLHQSQWGDGQRLSLGDVHRCLEYFKPADPREWGNPEKDHSRLATTYYHRFGPLGHLLERYNWFAGPPNTYWSDARMPAALIGSLSKPAGPAPLETLAQLWSEPPIGVIFLQAGTVASYGRPYQWIDFYEHNPEIVELFQPFGPKRSFGALQHSADRGAVVRIFEGSELEKLSSGPKNFYRALIVETGRSQQYFSRYTRTNVSDRSLDIFSKAVTEDGIICFHTSNRYDPVADDVIRLAKRAGFAAVHATDIGRDHDRQAHYSSEWVMVARRIQDVQFLTAPPPRWLQRPAGKRGLDGVDFKLQ
jgi:hypothetical protein